MGLLAQQPGPHNPDGLPVGFTRDTDDNGQTWLGLGCAACHVGEIHYQNTRLRIDGGPSLLDFTAFERSVLLALGATLNQSEKFARFAQSLKAQDPGALKSQLAGIHQSLRERHQMNHSDVAYGHGRLDAFGQIFNAAMVTFTQQPGNGQPPDAPVSFPMLWSAPHLDLVQWNGSAPNSGPGPLVQNVTTAIAVYGSVNIDADGLTHGYRSSVNFANLGRIQNAMYQLKSPLWPEPVLGSIDTEAASRGRELYDQHCVSCHQHTERNNPKRRLKATLTPVETVGTDPRAASNFLSASGNTGPLQGRHQAVIAGDRFGPQSSAIAMVVNLALGATLRQPGQALEASLVGFHKVIHAQIDQHPNYYKARSLDGIWASPPYLHNGSVPNLHELLLPASERSASFHVGSHEYQPALVGYVTEPNSDSSELNTKLPGNQNVGHEYGTQISEGERSDLLEYLKTL